MSHAAAYTVHTDRITLHASTVLHGAPCGAQVAATTRRGTAVACGGLLPNASCSTTLMCPQPPVMVSCSLLTMLWSREYAWSHAQVAHSSVSHTLAQQPTLTRHRKPDTASASLSLSHGKHGPSSHAPWPQHRVAQRTRDGHGQPASGSVQRQQPLSGTAAAR